MILKIIGILIIGAIPILIGHSKSRQVYEEKEEIDAWIRVISACEQGISYQNLPLQRIFSQISRGKCEKIDQIIDEISMGTMPKSAWEKISSDLYNAEMQKILQDFFNLIGSSDVDSQLKICGLALDRLRQLQDDSIENTEKKAKLYRTIGFLTGAFLIIIFI